MIDGTEVNDEAITHDGVAMQKPAEIQLTIGQITYEFDEYTMLAMAVASRDGHKMVAYAARVYDEYGRVYKRKEPTDGTSS